MSDQSGSSRLQALFDSALQDYEKQTGISLPRHPLAEQLQNCDSVDSVIAVLQQQAQTFSEFRGSHRIMKSLNGVVSVLSVLSSTASTLGGVVGLSFPPAKAIHTGLAILLATIKGVGASYDALAELLESIEHFLKRLDIYTKIPPTSALTEVVVKIMAELLSTLALATKQVQQGRPKKFVKKLFGGEREVEAVLQRLDRLTQDEARTTAAQTLEVVYGLVQNMRVVMDDQDGKASADSVRDALELMQQIASDMNRSKRDKLRQDIQSWLSPPDPWKNHNIACDSRQTGTAEWFVYGNTFSEWKSSGQGPLLWIHGKPGAGKSVLCSTIIEDIDAMRKTGLASLAFFYCDFMEDQKKDLRGLLSSLLVQLCHQSDSYCHILSKLYSDHAMGSRHPKDDTLFRCLKDIVELPGHAPVYLIVDALDECPSTTAMPSPREKVLMLVEELINSKCPNLRICVTSRPETDIKYVLDPLTFRSVSLHDQSGQVDDIENYIKSVINTDPRNRRWKAEDKQLTIEVLTKNAGGMFRWVYCQVVYLRGCHPGRIRQALSELPDTLDETYARTLREINKADWELAHRLFQCVAVASRPLNVEELAEFLAFDFKAGPIPKFHEGWRLEDPVEAVLSTCSSLLAVVHVDDSMVIQFSHFSVKEFLTSTRLSGSIDTISRCYYVSMTSAHTLVAKACLGLLLHLDENITRDNLLGFPLAKYAAEHWVDHARFENVSQTVGDSMKQLFDPNERHLAVWVWIHNPVLYWQEYEQAESPLPLRGTPLHYAAAWGLDVIIPFLVSKQSQDVHSNNRWTPLSLAMDGRHVGAARALLKHGARWESVWTQWHPSFFWGSVEVTRVLLEHGADATARDVHGSTPLHWASILGYVEVALVLLEYAADVTAQDENRTTPLHWASSFEHAEFALVLLEYGADATAQDLCLSTPLHYASQKGREGVTRILLQHGADATAQDKSRSTPLHWASRRDHPKVIRVLLEHGADATAQDESQLTPLYWALIERNAEVVRILLEHGVDTTAQDKRGLNPLHWVSQKGIGEFACILLDHGADVAARDKSGMTPLHWATRSGSSEVTRILLDHGADATARDSSGVTPLHRAASRSRSAEVARLLEYGADLTAKDKSSSTPLHCASRRGSAEVAHMLLNHGADATARDKSEMTPLHWASLKGIAELARILLEFGVDATSRDTRGLGPLHWASRWGSAEFARILLDHGADATARDKRGMTPLHWSSRGGRVEVTRVLLEHGADTTARDKSGSTPLHLASRGGHVPIARVLLQYGARPGTPNNMNWIPFQEASERGYRRMARLVSVHDAAGRFG